MTKLAFDLLSPSLTLANDVELSLGSASDSVEQSYLPLYMLREA